MNDAQKLEAIHRELFRLAAERDPALPAELPKGRRPHDFDIHIDGMIGFDGTTIRLHFEDSEWNNYVEGEGETFVAALNAAYTNLFGRPPLQVITSEDSE